MMTINNGAPLAGLGVAVFDFDGTVIFGDSLVPFLRAVAGRWRADAAFARAVETGMRQHLLHPRRFPDGRTAIKAELLKRLLGGVSLERAVEAAETLLAWRRWKPFVREAMLRHAEAGFRIVVATGSLDVYMPTLLQGLPVHDLLATQMVVDGGVMTGAMAAGNCVRAAKAARVDAFLRQSGPFAQTWGYGNRPHDLPMLALMQHGIVI